MFYGLFICWLGFNILLSEPLNEIDKKYMKESLTLIKNMTNYFYPNLLKNTKYNFDDAINKTEEIRKQENKGHGRFYINENGVIVFSQNNQPTTSITIFSNKPDLSKYINESKVFGKKNNIGIYEGPAPETKVIVRPIKI